MKVALDVAQTCVERAGCGYYADSLAHALARESGVTELQLLHHFGTWCNEDTAAGTSIAGKKVRSPLAHLDRGAAMRFWQDVAAGRTPLPGRPDIVHTCSFQAPLIPGVPQVATIHDVSFWTNPQFATEENRIVCQTGTLDAVDRAAGIVFVSQHAHDEFERVLGGWLAQTGRPWAVIHPAPRQLPKGNIRRLDLPPRFWLGVGSLEPRKNVEALLDAHERYWASARTPRPLVLAGSSGWKSENLRRRIAAAGADRVRYLGFVSDEELGGLYHRAEALVFPSWYEGFGLPVAEAMACGCPVICSDRASLPEVGGDAVRYVPPDDPAEIERALHELESHPVEQERLRRAGRERMQRFTWARAGRETHEFHLRVLQALRADA